MSCRGSGTIFWGQIWVTKRSGFRLRFQIFGFRHPLLRGTHSILQIRVHQKQFRAGSGSSNVTGRCSESGVWAAIRDRPLGGQETTWSFLRDHFLMPKLRQKQDKEKRISLFVWMKRPQNYEYYYCTHSHTLQVLGFCYYILKVNLGFKRVGPIFGSIERFAK